jgi:hypothetical protein
MKSAQSTHPCKSLPVRQAGVIQTSYDLVKAHCGEIKVNSKENEGTEFTITFPT